MLSLRKHIIPTDWYIHSIATIFKSGDKSLVNNYRPISLLCSISKVLEHLVYNKIISHIIAHQSPYQFGFLSNRSTLQQLLILFNDINNAHDQTDVIYSDFCKAFDSIPHNELLLKLKSMDISSKWWVWFKSYLLNRQQSVKINNTNSHLLPILSSIPYVSILSPLLFLININDIPDCAVAFIILVLLFANDTKCFKPVGNLFDSDQLQKDIDSLYKNEVLTGIFLSTYQSVYTWASSPRYKQPIYLSTITRTDTHHDLVSSNLSWEPHYIL